MKKEIKSGSHQKSARRRLHAAVRSLLFADLLAVMVLAPLAYGAVEAWSVALFELNALLLAVLLALKFVLKPESKFRFHPLMLPLVALLLLGLVQIWPLHLFSQAAPAGSPAADAGTGTLSLDPYSTQQTVVKLLALLIYFVVAIKLFGNRERLRVTLVVLTWFGFALAFFGIIQKLTWNGRLYWVRPISAGVPFGPFVNYNHFAGLMEMLFALPFAYLLFGEVSREKRALWFFASVMMAGSIVVSLSRGGLLALGIEIITFGVISRLLRKRWRTSAIPKAFAYSALAAIALLALWISYDQLAERWKNLSSSATELSVAGRIEAWRNSWTMIREHPLTGIGLGAFPAIYPHYGQSSAYHERLEQAHNDYLQLLTDGGLIGGLIGLWFLVELLRLVWRQWQKISADRAGSRFERSLTIGSLIAVLGLLIHSFTDFNLQITSNSLFFLIMIAIAASFDRQSEPPTTEH
ncbi:MAG: O-antigen ligase family protein [Blastocatellia bacterium]